MEKSEVRYWLTAEENDRLQRVRDLVASTGCSLDEAEKAIEVADTLSPPSSAGSLHLTFRSSDSASRVSEMRSKRSKAHSLRRRDKRERRVAARVAAVLTDDIITPDPMVAAWTAWTAVMQASSSTLTPAGLKLEDFDA